MAGRPRKQLPMSDEEIRREYRLAKNPAKQIRILADENSCDVKTIRRIVAEAPEKTGPDLSGFVPIQDLMEQGTEKEKDMIAIDPAPTTPTADPEWPPMPSAPPQAAADFDEAAPKQRDEAAQETAEAAVARSIKEASMPLLSAQTHFPREPWPRASSEDSAECPADWRGPWRPLADGGWAPTAQQPQVTAPAAADGGNIYRISGKDLSRMWHILGRLQGVLEASAEAGRPGEVMKDACDELEVLLSGIQQDAG